jgi:hypothetical protein
MAVNLDSLGFSCSSIFAFQLFYNASPCPRPTFNMVNIRKLLVGVSGKTQFLLAISRSYFYGCLKLAQLLALGINRREERVEDLEKDAAETIHFNTVIRTFFFLSL